MSCSRSAAAPVILKQQENGGICEVPRPRPNAMTQLRCSDQFRNLIEHDRRRTASQRVRTRVPPQAFNIAAAHVTSRTVQLHAARG